MRTTDARANSIADVFDYKQFTPFQSIAKPQPHACHTPISAKKLIELDGGVPD